MKTEVSFKELGRSFHPGFGVINNVSDGGFDRGYAAGYADGVSASGGNEFNDYLAGKLESVDFDGVSELRNYAFYSDAGIRSIRLSNVTKVGTSNFSNCADLEIVDLPSLTGQTNTYFCSGSRKLTTVNIPKVTMLNKFAFQNAAVLQVIDLPMVATIDTNVFSYCNQLKTVILRKKDGVVTLAGGVSVFARANIYVPASLVEQYKVATNWSTYAAQFRALEDYTVDGTVTGELDESKI